MKIEHVNPTSLHGNPAFTQLVTVEGIHKLAYVGGQNALDVREAFGAAQRVWGPHPMAISVVTVVGLANPEFLVETEADTARPLEELVAHVGADPTSAVRKHLSYREAKRHLAELGAEDQLEASPPGGLAEPGHSFSKSEFFRRPLPTETVAALVEHFPRERIADQVRVLDFTPWGGAYNRVPADATAFVHRGERFLLKHEVVVAPDASPGNREAARRWLARSWELVHPWGSGGVYPNFPDPDLVDWAHAYYGTNYDHLARVKARYDPGGFFRFHQSLPSQSPGRGTPP